MLKARIIPTLLIRDVNLVKGHAFDSWRSIGSPMQSVKIFNRRDVDELILLDIVATPDEREPNYGALATLAQECFVPLTIGGGIRSVDSIRQLLLLGADKVAINTAGYEDPQLISEAAALFGSQCIVASIDYRSGMDGNRKCFSHCGIRDTERDLVRWAKHLEQLGAGEILLTAIERDGTMTGYDLEGIEAVSRAVSIPVIASGGASDYNDLRDAIQIAGASAVSAASLYLFTQATPLEAKHFLAEAGLPVRSSYAT